jgi:hypothetical protein
MDIYLLCLYVVLSWVGRGLWDGLITRLQESYRVSNSVSLRNLRGGGQGPICAVEPMDGWIWEENERKLLCSIHLLPVRDWERLRKISLRVHGLLAVDSRGSGCQANHSPVPHTEIKKYMEPSLHALHTRKFCVYVTQHNVTTEWLALSLRIRRVPSSNLGSQTG